MCNIDVIQFKSKVKLDSVVFQVFITVAVHGVSYTMHCFKNIRWLTGTIKQRHARYMHFKVLSLLFLARACADASVSKNPVNGVNGHSPEGTKTLDN